jgi:hypothetical protein
VILSIWGAGCLAGQNFRTQPSATLEERFVLVGSASDGEPKLYRDFEVIRRGRREKALVLVAPVSLRAPIAARDGRSVHLEALATAVFNIGDGMALDVAIVQGTGRIPVYSRYFDPGRRAADRDWARLDIRLDLQVGPDAEIELRLGPGPQGDLVGDWLALARLRPVSE